ncbi:MAG: LysM peptidoglycan-binding domain-containing protein [Pseudomonadota bacterium]
MRSLFEVAVAASLSPVPAQADDCGGPGQYPCTLNLLNPWGFEGFCDEGLDHIPFVACVPPVSAADLGDTALEVTPLLIEIAIKLQRLQNTSSPANLITHVRIMDALHKGDIERAEALLRDHVPIDEAREVARNFGMETLAIGVTGGGSIIGGGGGEAGIAFHTERDEVAFYTSSYTTIGVQFGLGADFVASTFLKPPQCIGGKSIAANAYIDAGPGAGGMIVRDERKFFSGTALYFGIIGGGLGLAQVTANADVQTGPACNEYLASLIEEDEDEGDTGTEPVIATVTVEEGDTLWALSGTHMGDNLRYDELYAANTPPLTDPDMIFPGQVLTLP